MPSGQAARLLDHEARSILVRAQAIRPFSEEMPSVAAAALPGASLVEIERGLLTRRRRICSSLDRYLVWLRSGEGRRSAADEAQRRLARTRLVFTALLHELDLFSDALTQRSEHRTGRLLAGLDFAAEDLLRPARIALGKVVVVSYLDRGAGAAIRRAFTRLPGGGTSPVALLRVPRERMGSTGLAGSVAHEVGHQAAALLGLVPALRDRLERVPQTLSSADRAAWSCYVAWASEMLADFWAVGRIGVTHGLGLFSLFNLPAAHVFAGGAHRVHPTPWIRVLLSLAFGQALYPDPQWARLARAWQASYPVDRAKPEQRALLQRLQRLLPSLVSNVVELRPRSLEGQPLGALLRDPRLVPSRLGRRHEHGRLDPRVLERVSPTLVFAVLGHARATGQLSATSEREVLQRLILGWSTARFRRGGT